MVRYRFKNNSIEDRIVFDQIYSQYHQVIYANIFKLIKDPTLAEDILQDVFFALWENRAKIDPEQSVSSWLFVVSYNQSISHLRKKLKQGIQYVESYDPFHAVAEEIFPDKRLIEADLNMLEEAINALPPQRQKVFKLCRFEGKSQKETAQLLGLSIESVKDYLKQSKNFIKEYILSKHSSGEMISILLMVLLINL
ncbi:sigma-70 family RNA polymerase sigma factor [Pedobacter petrophilus]|uniref:Sigma-70 family RNA polymerase sigma factor n=1 Tax=Pedobacter petrophilus TaxID=1908241 RepID=A0A7K0FXZ0_9SPHI|nr:sigma-70 family RNA polymerase sigma factor [Pedobacter petrophilus]MRX76467.1 sigma-70 family RNA polymerase sigma factor [Pedobacter petrophilus]